MNNTKKHLFLLILFLFIFGSSLMIYRHYFLDIPLKENTNVTTWTVELNIKFNPQSDQPIKLSVLLPYIIPNYAILDEYFVSHHYGVSTNVLSFNREGVWSIRRAYGPQHIFYRAIVKKVDDPFFKLPEPEKPKKLQLDDVKKTAVDSIINSSRQASADVQTFTQAVIKSINSKNGDSKLLLEGTDDSDKYLKAILIVLNQAQIPAMEVTGITLTQQNTAWRKFVMVHNGHDWFFFDPHTGNDGLPKNVLIWHYGNQPLYNLIGGSNSKITINTIKTPLNALSVARSLGLQKDSQLLRFSLLPLPVPIQDSYKILLTIPLGAFVILILRNFLGLKTFGTFMPVLIALAFRETHIIWGVLLFSIIIFFGLLVRFYLDQLRLLLVPRLASILTVVILLMLIISILSQTLNFERGLSVALFPMVILTMTIERMCVTWDERGASESIISGIGSLFAAIVAYQVMNIISVQYLFFAFPEALLILLGFILLFGQYRGYRLSELIRFKAFSKLQD